MSTINRLAQSGNQIVVKQDNKTVGLIQSVRANDDFGPEPLSGIGEITAQEHVPTMARYSLSVSYMSLRKQSMFSENVAFDTPEDALLGTIFDIVIQDKDTGSELRKYEGCSFASGDIEISKHQIVVTNAQFMALRASGNMLSS